MDTPESIVQGNIILSPTTVERTSQETPSTTVPADPEYFLRVPQSKIPIYQALVNRRVDVTAERQVTVELLPKSRRPNRQNPEALLDIAVNLEDIAVNLEELDLIRGNLELAPYLRMVHHIETKNDTAIALAMMNSAAAREAGAMQSLELGPEQVVGKYTQFVGELGGSFNSVVESIAKDLRNISANPATLDGNKTQELQNKLALMSTIIGSLLRLVPGGSIGSLSNGTDKAAQGQIDALKKWQNKFQDIEDQIKNLGNSSCRDEEIAEIVQSLANVSIRAEVKSIQDAIGPSISAPSCVNFLLQDFRIIQFMATGVALLEKLDKQGSTEARQLYDRLNGGSLGTYGPAKGNMEFMKTVRKSGFFMEYSYKELDKRIVETFVKEVNKQLSSQSPPIFLSSDQKSGLQKALAKKLEKLRDQTGKSDEIKGGFRGRDVSTQINGHIKPLKQIFTQQGPVEIRGKPVGDFSALTESDGEARLSGEAKAFFQAIRSDGGFNRLFRPQQSATLDVIDHARVKMLNDPVGFLQEALEEAGQSGSLLFKQLGTNERKAAIQRPLQTVLLNTKFPDELGNPKLADPSTARKATSWQIRDLVDGVDVPGPELRSIKSKPSFAASMMDHGLQTFCSISGTTTDIVVGMVAQMGGDPRGKAEMAKKLRPLVELVEASFIDPNQLARQEFDSFKTLFLSISLYMQSGQYHTTSEVLAGLYCAALNVCPAGNPPHPPATDVMAFGKRFEKLCTAFQSNPAAFFPAITSQRRAA
ncbi:MAG: hypothetical protein LBJ75_01010 [Puniceicoccales bacterium]|jgi:hypothetical protein|nr:hypothetical protein [Puniceicoccales bacterium]